MRPEALLSRPEDLADAEAMIATNLLGPIRLTSALLPVLRTQPRAAVMMVSSGLAFVPLALTPTYCATKAAIHSYTQSLRYQLKETAVQVLELIPPYVQTTHMGEGQASDARAMPLEEFLAEVMEILSTQPDAPEICVGRVRPLRFAAGGRGFVRCSVPAGSGTEKYEQTFQGLNAAMSSADEAGH